MNIKLHNQYLTQLAQILGTDQEDCAAWLLEILMELREDLDDHEGELFEKLGDNLYAEQIPLLADALIEHYSKENEVQRNKIVGLIYNIKVH